MASTSNPSLFAFQTAIQNCGAVFAFDSPNARLTFTASLFSDYGIAGLRGSEEMGNL
jgi:hypothetical protein